MSPVGRNLLNLALAAVFVAIGGACWSPSALAGTATVEPCANGVASEFHYWTNSNTNSRWDLDSYCPMVADLTAKPYQPGQSSASYWMLFGSGLFPPAIKEMRFSMTGSDGSETSMEQGIRACATNNCGPIVTPGGPNVNTPVQRVMSVESSEIPEGANRVRIDGWCRSSGGCQAARSMQVRNLQIDIEDNVAPTVEFAPQAFGTSNPKPVSFDGWNPGRERTFHLMLRDSGVGVQFAKMKLGVRTFEIDEFGCGRSWDTTIAYRCSTAQYLAQVENLGGGVNVWALEEGPNVISVVAHDAAGNVSEKFTREFLLDSRVPTWRDLRATTTQPSGWQSSTVTELVWTPLNESFETFTQSGIKRIRFAIESVDEMHVDVPAETRDLDSPDAVSDIQLPGNGRFRLSAVLIDGAGNESDEREAFVSVDDTVLDAPMIDPRPMVGPGELEAGADISWQQPANRWDSPSGICGYALRVDRSPTADAGDVPNVVGEVTSALLPSSLPDGTNYVHLRAFTCAGVPGDATTMAFEVDAASPTISVSKPSQSGWYNANHPLVFSAADGIGGELESRLTVGSDVGSWIATPTQAPALADGKHDVTFEVRDERGNLATLRVDADIDANAPDVRLAQRDPDHPTLVRALVADNGSGPAGGSIQIRPVGGAWRQLAGTFRIGETGHEAEIVARIPDLELPAGSYELRASATDLAGHVSESTPADPGARVELPMRAEPAVSAGFRDVVVKRRCVVVRSKRTCKNVTSRSELGKLDTRVVAYTKSDEIRGRLVDAEGFPMGGRTLDVTEEVLGRSRKHVGEVLTNSDGTFRFLPSAGPSRRIVFRFAGGERDAPAETAVRLLVRARIDLKVKRRVVRGGQPVAFFGRIHAAGATIPRAGLRVSIEYRSGRVRGQLSLRMVAGSDGRFTGRYRFRAGIGPLKLQFRAEFEWVDGFAYEGATSKPVTVVVR